MKREWSGADTIELHFLPQTPYGKGTQKIKTALSKTAQTESQEVSSFPDDVHQAILNNINNSSKTNRKRTNNYNYETPHYTVSNKLLAGGGGLSRIHAAATLALGSTVLHRQTSCSVRVKDSSKHWDETRWVLNSNTILKRVSNRSQTVEPWWARPRLKRTENTREQGEGKTQHETLRGKTKRHIK